MGLAPSMRGILCTSPSFRFGGAHVGNAPGTMSVHRFLYGLGTFNKRYLVYISQLPLGGARVGNALGNTLWYLHNTIHNVVLYCSLIFSKCGIAPSGRSLSLYKISCKNRTGLPDVFNYLLYIMWDPFMDPSGNLYHTSITLVGRFF